MGKQSKRAVRRLRGKTDHIVVRPAANLVLCLRCRGKETIVLPATGPQIARQITAFRVAHAGCPEAAS